MKIGDGFNTAAALDQESFRASIAQANSIETIIADCAQAVEYARPHGGKRLERAKLRLQMALAERRRRVREEARAA